VQAPLGIAITAAQLSGVVQKFYSAVATGSVPTVVIPVPIGFTELKVIWSARSDTASAATYMTLQLNGDAGSNYNWQINQANNSTAGPGNSGGNDSSIHIGAMTAASAGANFFASGEFCITNASSNSVFKSAAGHATAMVTSTNAYSGTYGGLWGSTNAVSSITLKALAGNIVAGSSFVAYGF
jgi:hypothetical protein